MSDYIQATITILSLVNPVICGTIFIGIEGRQSAPSPVADASKAVIAIFVILAAAALFGARLLDAFGISLDAFQVAGGIVLAWMGFSMLRGASSHQDSQQPEGDSSAALAPLILFAASPGTITGVMTIAISHSDTAVPITALVGIAVALGVTLVVMLLAVRSGGGGGGLGRDVSTRFMGLIVLAMGVQFALSAYRDFMAA